MTQRKGIFTRHRGHRLIRHMAGLAGLCLVAWLAGLQWFATGLPNSVAEPLRVTDAIVVLTGGSGRVHQGLELLAAKRAGRLFISGVYRGVDVQELLRVSQKSPGDLECCVTLGYKADSTRGNARETAGWMREQGLVSLRLVTSDYHMPRSLLEFRRVLPDAEIVPHPVLPERAKPRNWWRWPGSTTLIIREYNKYLFALARGPFDG
jgi:uncharacterized SAM-binding protein YcdF (DUF218 family)